MAKILLVDDNASILLTLAIALRRRGHSVTVSISGEEALAQIAQKRFDILISDVRMPGMSGLQLAARVQQMTLPPRVILTSAYSTIEARSELAETLLRKPIDIAQLDALLCDQTAELQHRQRAALSMQKQLPVPKPVMI